MCEGKILHKECELMLEMFQNNKVPGNEGFRLSFIKNFGHCLVNPL